MKIIARALALVAMLIASTVALAAEQERITGYARVIDGDSLVVNGVRIRLAGIDAPELSQTCDDPDGRPYACGRLARLSLVETINGAEVTCEKQDIDRYGRVVATCSSGRGSMTLNAIMVATGLAVDYARYSHGAYAAEQAEAQREKRGLWSGGFVQPETWRKEHRDGYRGAN